MEENINANELRLGNKIIKFGIDYIGENPVVDRSDFEIIDVTIDVLQNIIDFDGSTDYYYCEPVPLTEAWLLKFGYTASEKDYNNKSHFYEKGKHKIWCPFNQFLDNNYRFEIKHVHQLQNLYFSITQTELLMV
jgi:hypothetical protein